MEDGPPGAGMTYLVRLQNLEGGNAPTEAGVNFVIGQINHVPWIVLQCINISIRTVRLSRCAGNMPVALVRLSACIFCS